MGLLKGDLEKVPKSLELKDCYSRILIWHRKFGQEKLKSKQQSGDKYGLAYLNLLSGLPSPNKASKEDMAFVFGEVIYGLMEWAYHQEDQHGIKTAAYAHFATDRFFDGNLGELQEEAKKSRLYNQYKLQSQAT